MKPTAALPIQVISLIILTVSILVASFDRIVVSPSQVNLMIASFSDSEDMQVNGSQTTLFESNDERVRFHYKLGATNEFPYIGFSMEMDSSRWDFSRYDEVTVKVEPDLTDNFTLQVSTFIDGFTDNINGLSYRLFEADIDAVSSATIKVPLKNLDTPTWWFSANGINVNHNRESLKNTTQIRFQSHPLTPRSEQQRIHINSITFGHSRARFVPFIIFALLGLSIGNSLKKRRKIPFVPLNISTRSCEELELLEQFIGREYARLDISLQKTVLETGLSESTIRSLLKEFHNMGFKEYLNSIRLTEGARLLIESDRQIAEIALYVGFRHPTTFTKLFRQFNSLSPSEYRDKKRG